MLRRSCLLLSISFLAPHIFGESPSSMAQAAASPTIPLPEPQIFAPGVISGPANDGAPTFSPDGNTLFFTRSAAHWTVILESHKVHDEWTKPTLATFSGQWPDS